jgi:hypothetical protein
LRVKSIGFRGSGFMVWGVECIVQGKGYRVCGSRFAEIRLEEPWLQSSGIEFMYGIEHRVQSTGCRT